MKVRHINLVGKCRVVAVVEAQHANIHLYCRIIVQKYGQARSEAYIEVEIMLVCACDIISGAAYDFRLSAAELQLHFIEKAETGALSEAEIASEQGCAVVAVADAVEVVDVVRGLGVENDIGRV